MKRIVLKIGDVFLVNIYEIEKNIFIRLSVVHLIRVFIDEHIF